MSSGQDLADVLGVAFSFFGGAALSFAVVWLDERWSSEARLERAWPSSTRLAATVAFGPLCLPVHFWRTRRSLLGILLGLLLGAGVLAVNVAVSWLLEASLT